MDNGDGKRCLVLLDCRKLTGCERQSVIGLR